MTHWTVLTEQLFHLLHVVGRSVRPPMPFRLTQDPFGGMGPSLGRLLAAGLIVVALFTVSRWWSTNGWLLLRGRRRSDESVWLVADRRRSIPDSPVSPAWRPHVSSRIGATH